MNIPKVDPTTFPFFSQHQLVGIRSVISQLVEEGETAVTIGKEVQRLKEQLFSEPHWMSLLPIYTDGAPDLETAAAVTPRFSAKQVEHICDSISKMGEGGGDARALLASFDLMVEHLFANAGGLRVFNFPRRRERKLLDDVMFELANLSLMLLQEDDKAAEQHDEAEQEELLF